MYVRIVAIAVRRAITGTTLSAILSAALGATVSATLSMTLGAALGTPLRAQTTSVLSLADALREADHAAFANRVTSAGAAVDRSRARQPLAGILPTVRLEAGVVRTTDPIGAFGTTLRQRSVSPEAFDPARLNNPAAITNVQGGLVIELPLLNGDAWTGWRSARTAADASDAQRDWTTSSTRASVVRAYYGAVLSAEKVSMLASSEKAADAALRQVEAMVRQGLVTKADVLQASVRLSDVRSQLLAATHDRESARRQLAILLGRADAVLPVLPDKLPSDAAIRDAAARTLATGDTTDLGIARHIETRADVQSAALAASAASGDRRRATTTLLPRINAIARYDWNDPRTLYAGQKNWTMGVMASWSLFGGGRELADVRAAQAREAQARAGSDATIAHARADVMNARQAITLTMQQLSLATDAAAQSAEARRLVDKRYAGGLATIAELLAADAASTASALALAAARFALIDALARHQHAVGGDAATLVELDVAR